MAGGPGLPARLRDERGCRACLAQERDHDRALLDEELRDWGAAIGQRFPAIAMRHVTGEVRALGADTGAWLAC